MKKIAVLGSTGSIGTQTLEVVRAQKDIEVTALAAGSNITRLEEQIREFHPEIVCVWEEEKAKELALMVSDLPVKVVCGMPHTTFTGRSLTIRASSFAFSSSHTQTISG